MAETIREAVEQAMIDASKSEEIQQSENGKEKPTERVVVDESSKQKEDEGSKEKAAGPSKERIEEGLKILAILEDPKLQKQFIKALASSVEEDIEDKSSKDAKKSADDLVTRLKNKIGEEHEYLLSPILAVVEDLLEERDQKILSTISENERNRMQLEYNRQYQDYMTDNEVTQEEQNRIQTIAEDIPAKKGETLNAYLNRLRKFAKQEINEEKEKTRKTETINRNANKAKFDKSETSGDFDQKQAPVIKSPRDAVMQAMKELTEK